MTGFECYQVKPRRVMAAQYAKDTANKGILTMNSLISQRNDSVNLILTTPAGEVAVEPGDWIVKMDGDFQRCTQEEFDQMFEPIKAGVSCLFCGDRFPNTVALKDHSDACKAHPKNRQVPA